MSRQGKNTALRGLLDEAEMSNSALGRAVVAAGAREGKHVGTNTTSVRRMLAGCQPRWPAPRLVASVLSQRLQREVSVTECGFADCVPPGEDPYDGLRCSGTLEGTVRTVVELSGQDMHRPVAAAATYVECVVLMCEAIAGHLEVMREHGDPIPVPSAINAFTVVAA